VPAVAHEGGADGLGKSLGLEYLELGPELVRARMPVAPGILQPQGVVHGGAITAMAESMCSQATWDAVREEGNVALGQATHTTFLRAIGDGFVNGTATRRAGGRSLWIWDVEVSDDEGRTCALVRLTIAVRPAR
jgi:uncharacterized protein (TIGR00369 family)